MNQEPSLYPAWKQALKELLDGGLTYGGQVSREQIISLCGIAPARSIEDVQRFSLECLAAICEIRDTLLAKHSMLMVSDQRGGYVIVHPRDQTKVVVNSGVKAVTREMERMTKGVTYVNRDLLTDEERAQNADAQAKVARLADMVAPAKAQLRQLL